ncbi:hypothetical protein ACFL60_03635 [Candidatus Omnitrophota bacterium]
MKKMSIFLVPIILLMAIGYGCSKDHEAPTFSQYENVSEPTDVEATYLKDTDQFKITWSFDDPTDVINYLVSWSDSNLFDDGVTSDQYVIKDLQNEVLKNEIVLEANDVYKGMEYFELPDIDVFLVYFTVAAVFNNEDKGFSYFIGPRAVVDREGTYADSTAVVFKEEE